MNLGIVIILSIFLILLLILFILFGCLCLQQYLDVKNFDRSVYNPDNFKSGDIVCTQHANCGAYQAKILMLSGWHHLGVIWRDKETNTPYVLEGCLYRGFRKGIFAKISLDKWINSYHKNCKICHLSVNKDIDSDELYKHFLIISNEDLKTNWLNDLEKYTIKRKYVEYPDKSEYKDRTCIEGAILLLQKSGIIKKEYDASSYFAVHIVKNFFECENGYSYSKPKIIYKSSIYRYS